MSHISATDLKTKGISAIELALSSAPEAVVSVRGKDKFVVMGMAHHHYLREGDALHKPARLGLARPRQTPREASAAAVESLTIKLRKQRHAIGDRMRAFATENSMPKWL